MTTPIQIRRADADDLRFVRSSWLTSAWRSGIFKNVSNDVLFTFLPQVLEETLRRSKVTIACFASVPDEILSWCCTENDTLHFVYTKHSYRRQRLATALLKQENLKWHSLQTPSLKHLRLATQFNPFLFHL